MGLYKKVEVATKLENNKDETVVETVEKDTVKEEATKRVSDAVEKFTEKKKPDLKHKLAKTKPDLCNIRAKASADAPIVQVVSRGAEFKVVEDADAESKGYVSVSIQGNPAFIRKDLVDVFENPAYKAHDSRKFG